jgi:iron complex outermembrane receptor protein
MNTACGIARNLLALTSGVVLPSLAGAQIANSGPPAASQARAVLADVVVTAQRREERLQSVPISASVLTTAQLELQQVGKLHELQYAVPNLVMAPNRSSSTTATIAIRGQVELETTPTVDPAVGLYLGGVYLARTTGANLELIDVERVEVLRGPQGTLFGRNTTGGAINLVPRAPSFEREGLLEANLGNYDLAEFTAVVNAPLNDRLATRLVAAHAEHGGYGRNVLLDASLEDEDVDYVRVQVRLVPSARSEFFLSFDGSQTRTAGQMLTLLDVAPAADTLPAVFGYPTDRLTDYVDPFSRRIPADRVGPASTNVWGASGLLTVEFSRLTLKSITAYRQLELSASDVDQDATPYDLGVILFRGDTQHQFSQEFQTYGVVSDDRLQWIGGLHYFQEEATYRQDFRAYLPTSSRWDVGMPAGDVRNDSFAAYAQVTYAISPLLRVTGGARYNIDGRRLTSRNRQELAGVVTCRLDPTLRDAPETCQATLPERTFAYVPWTIAVDYQPASGAMLYAKLSRGHRAGGYNIRGSTVVDLDTFEPEQVTTSEIGAKLELLDNHLRFNAALFRSQFDDIQLTQREPAAPGLGSIRYIENGGRALIEGGEVEITALLGPLRLGFGYGVTRPQFTELDKNVEGVTLDSRFPMVPDWTATVSADWVRPIGSWELDAHADYAWRDDVPFSYDAASAARQDSYGLLNAAVAVRPPHGGLEIRLWGRNLADRRYLERAFESVYYVSAAPGDPRTYGLSLAYRFGEP